MRFKLLVVLGLFALRLFPQEKGYLEFAGRCVKDHLPVKGANVSIYKGSTKVTELNTPKNGKFQFFLNFGVDYKIVYTLPGCAEMYCMIYASRCPENKSIFPIYEVDVNFFEYNKPTINYANFKNPFTKISYDGKKSFMDDEAYVQEFLDNLYINPEEIKKRDAELAAYQAKKELEAKMKLESEERERKRQLQEAERLAQEEADRIKRQAEEKARSEKPATETKNVIAAKETQSQQSMASEEMNLSIEKEKRNLKEKQNKAIRSTYENDLLKIVATNERSQKEAAFEKKKGEAAGNEVIETLKREAEVKARSEQVVFDSKVRNRTAALNRGIRNQEMTALIKQSAFNQKSMHASLIKNFPEATTYKPKGLTAITTDIEKSTFKTVYTSTIINGLEKTIYRRESFNWGLNYYYKNDKEIPEADYLKELSPYNIK